MDGRDGGDDDIETATRRRMTAAAMAGDARALRRAFAELQRGRYATTGRLMTARDVEEVLNGVDARGMTLMELASMAERLDAHRWLSERVGTRAMGTIGDSDAAVTGRGAADAFEERLRDEHALEDGHGRLEALEEVDGAIDPGESGRGGVLGDENHRASVWAEASRRRRAREDDSGDVRRVKKREREKESENRREAERRRLEALRAEDARWRASLEVTTAEPKSSAARTTDEYRKKWAKLERAARKGKTHELSVEDFPFVDESKMSPASVLRDFLIVDVPSGNERAQLREEMLRWHPDKFAKYLDLAVREELQDVVERVNATSQAVREAFKAFVVAPS